MIKVFFEPIDEEDPWSDPSIDLSKLYRLLNPDIDPSELIDLSDLEVLS